MGYLKDLHNKLNSFYAQLLFTFDIKLQSCCVNIISKQNCLKVYLKVILKYIF